MIMSGFFRKAVSALMVVVLLGACQTTQNSANNANLTPEERRLREQAEDFNTTVVEGAIVGALAGAILGALLSSNNRAQGAAIGAGAGAAIGAGSGYYVAKQKEQFANEQARLDSMITEVKADNNRLEAFIQTTNTVVAKNREELNAMQVAVKNGTKKRADMQALLVRAEGNRDAIQVAIANLKENRAEYLNASNQMRVDAGNTVDVGPYDAEIARLDGQIQVLEREYADLSRVITVNQL